MATMLKNAGLQTRDSTLKQGFGESLKDSTPFDMLQRQVQKCKRLEGGTVSPDHTSYLCPTANSPYPDHVHHMPYQLSYSGAQTRLKARFLVLFPKQEG